MRPLLNVKALRKVFSGKGRPCVTAVDCLDFSVYPGETLGIVGESGSGKSTVAKLITRLIEPTAGEIFFEDRNILKLRHRELPDYYQNIQMIFQTPADSFDPRHTLGYGIGESLRMLGMRPSERKSRAQELLKLCGLEEEFLSRYPHEVSGGQCQRAAIARALAVRPKLLICDEATSSLDVTVQKQILELLVNLRRKEAISYLFISHNLAVVQELCDRILVMKNGIAVESGATNEVIFHPKDPYTKKLIASVL
ncbi:MAG: ATP-binding cassette domain-containing protein [Eubacteriales bacterium]|nr:ATP-binding cassette domain-containing protein [Eubacteriales bacterium]